MLCRNFRKEISWHLIFAEAMNTPHHVVEFVLEIRAGLSTHDAHTLKTYGTDMNIFHSRI